MLIDSWRYITLSDHHSNEYYYRQSISCRGQEGGKGRVGLGAVAYLLKFVTFEFPNRGETTVQRQVAFGAGLLLAILLTGEQVVAEGGKEFAPKNMMFTITIPTGPKSGQRTRVINIGRNRVPLESSYSTLKDGTSFVGGSIGIPAVAMRDLPAEKRFDVLRDALLKPMNGKAVEEKEIKQDPVPGKEYQIDLPKGKARLQLYTVAGFVVYGLVEGKTKEQVNSKEADEFFQSLKLTDKAKDVFRDVKR